MYHHVSLKSLLRDRSSSLLHSNVIPDLQKKKKTQKHELREVQRRISVVQGPSNDLDAAVILSQVEYRSQANGFIGSIGSSLPEAAQCMRKAIHHRPFHLVFERKEICPVKNL